MTLWSKGCTQPTEWVFCANIHSVS